VGWAVISVVSAFADFPALPPEDFKFLFNAAVSLTWLPVVHEK